MNDANIVSKINDQSSSFKLFIKQVLEKEGIWSICEKLLSSSDVIVFGGIIRDFLLGNFDSIRDLDLVVKQRLPKNFFTTSELHKFDISRNQFGGLKLKRKALAVDIWYIEDTWGIKTRMFRPTEYSMVKTVFFNATAISYSLRRERFVFDNSFIKFLSNNELDVVFTINPNVSLCIINTMDYVLKQKCHLSPRLKKWISYNYSKELPFEDVQKKHFGEVKYSLDNISHFISSINDY